MKGKIVKRPSSLKRSCLKSLILSGRNLKMSAQVDCPVCLNAITDLVNCATTNCGHKFHTSCLLRCVLKCGNKCPYCRSSMTGQTEEDIFREFLGLTPIEPVIEPIEEPIEEPDVEPVEELVVEPIIVKKMVYNGIIYLVAKRTGEMFDYNTYIQTGEQIEVGRWYPDIERVELYA